MRVVCIVQARMGSKRLPGKVLLPLNGHTVIEEILMRCKRIPGVDKVICAIPDNHGKDDVLAMVASRCVEISRGSEHDVLGRYYEAATQAQADIVVRITGDCPLICPELCGEVLAALKRTGAGYSSNLFPRTFPHGLDCEAFTMKALRYCQDVLSPTEDYMREHVTPLMQQSGKIRRVNVENRWNIEGRVTLDTKDDYKVICAAFGHEPYQRLHAA